jgi:hypothetical protein
MALFAVDAAGATVAIMHRVAGEPFGVGGSLNVRNPAVVALWGTALSAPITTLGFAAALYRHRPEGLRVMGAAFAVGALSEPVFWGRRPCPRLGRVLLATHVIIASALAIGPARNRNRAQGRHGLTDYHVTPGRGATLRHLGGMLHLADNTVKGDTSNPSEC